MENKFKAGDRVCYKTHPDICIGTVSPDIEGGIYLCVGGKDMRQIPIFISDNWASFFGNGSCLNTMHIDEDQLMLYENIESNISNDEIEQYALLNDKFIKACRRYCSIMGIYDRDYRFLDSFNVIDHTVYATGYTSWDNNKIYKSFPEEYLFLSSDDLVKLVKPLIDSRNAKIIEDLMNTSCNETKFAQVADINDSSCFSIQNN